MSRLTRGQAIRGRRSFSLGGTSQREPPGSLPLFRGPPTARLSAAPLRLPPPRGGRNEAAWGPLTTSTPVRRVRFQEDVVFGNASLDAEESANYFWDHYPAGSHHQGAGHSVDEPPSLTEELTASQLLNEAFRDWREWRQGSFSMADETADNLADQVGRLVLDEDGGGSPMDAEEPQMTPPEEPPVEPPAGEPPAPQRRLPPTEAEARAIVDRLRQVIDRGPRPQGTTPPRNPPPPPPSGGPPGPPGPPGGGGGGDDPGPPSGPPSPPHQGAQQAPGNERLYSRGDLETLMGFMSQTLLSHTMQQTQLLNQSQGGRSRTSNSNYTEDGERTFHSHKNLTSFDHDSHGQVYDLWRTQMKDDCATQRRSGLPAITHILGWIKLDTRRLVDLQVKNLRRQYDPLTDPQGDRLLEDFWKILDGEFGEDTDLPGAAVAWKQAHRGRYENPKEWSKRCQILYLQSLGSSRSQSVDLETDWNLIDKYTDGMYNPIIADAITNYKALLPQGGKGTFSGTVTAACQKWAAVRTDPGTYSHTMPWAVRNIQDMSRSAPAGQDKLKTPPRWEGSGGPPGHSPNRTIAFIGEEDPGEPSAGETETALGPIVAALRRAPATFEKWKATRGARLQIHFEGSCDTCGGWGHKRIQCPSRSKEAADAVERILKKKFPGNKPKMSPKISSVTSNPTSNLVAALQQALDSAGEDPDSPNEALDDSAETPAEPEPNTAEHSD